MAKQFKFRCWLDNKTDKFVFYKREMKTEEEFSYELLYGSGTLFCNKFDWGSTKQEAKEKYLNKLIVNLQLKQTQVCREQNEMLKHIQRVQDKIIKGGV